MEPVKEKTAEETDFQHKLAIEVLARFTGNSRGTPIAKQGFIDGALWAEQVASLRVKELQWENAVLRQGMVDAFNAGKNADEWDQMCGWIQHYTYSDWVTKWRRTNSLPKQPKI